MPSWVEESAETSQEAKKRIAEWVANLLPENLSETPDVGIRSGNSTVFLFEQALHDAFWGKPPPAPKLESQIEIIKTDIAHYFSKHPDKLYELSPEAFEDLVADILEDRGCEVQKTPRSRDKGRDILAVFTAPTGAKHLTIVECKKYRRDRTIGVQIARAFLYVLDQQDKANCGIIAATSFFSPEVKQLQKIHEFRLHLRDLDGITEWLSKYGTWNRKADSGIWTPRVS